MPFKIHKLGSEALTAPNLIVKEDRFGTDGLKLLINEMLACTVLAGGIGLAAPQIGKNLRIFVMLDSPKTFVCINPVILEASEATNVFSEGCLSFPGLYLDITRSTSVKVAYYDEEGKRIEEDLDGIQARCFQHELDHLNEILFTSYVKKVKLDQARRKAKILERKKKRLKRK